MISAETMTLVKYALPYLLKGLVTTLEVVVCAIALGMCIAILITACRLMNIKPLSRIFSVYVSFIRGTPFLVQIYIIYYVISSLVTNVNPFMTGVICLGFNSGAFLSELIRAGVTSIPIGHIEAAKALGMSDFQIMCRIIFPQVFDIIKPQLITEFIADIKGTPMLSIVALVELTRAGQLIIYRKHQPIPIYICMAIIYLIVNLLLEELVKFVEKKGKQKQTMRG